MGQTKRGPSNRHLADVRPEYTLLGFLMHRSMHGYDLYNQFQLHLGHVWHLSQSQLYSTLKRLEAQGLVEGLTNEAGANPSRRYLAITQAGLRRFFYWLMQPSDCSSRIMRLEFISRLFFASMQDPAIAAYIVQGQAASVARELSNHERILRSLEAEDRFNRLALEFRIRQLSAQLLWLEKDVAPLVPGMGAAET
jgi:PadR family transcriptional regulator, regulatory protein AphA